MKSYLDKVKNLEEAKKTCDDIKALGGNVVFTNGCFDILHPGHTRYLNEARNLGEHLVVAVNSDRSVRSIKDPGRPILNEKVRAEMIASLASVDTVIIFDEVDSGIGGATAEVVGEKLLSLAEYHQILCITHLPQIASKGEAHFLVAKRVKHSRTQTIISKLDHERRIEEIARLLGGKVISEQAVAHAREMLG